MKNNDFIEKYCKGVKGVHLNGHCGIFNNIFVNYSTILCRTEGKTAYLNKNKYSRTTSKIQGYLAYCLKKYDYTIVEVEGTPAVYWNFGYQGARNITAGDVYTAR